MKLSLIIGLFILLASCGKSPFVEDSANKQVYGNSNLETQRVRDFSLGEYKVVPSLVTTPIVYDPNVMIVSILDKNNNPVDPAYDFDMYLWMPDHGHGSFKITITRLSKGHYRASDIFFTMPGYWDLHFVLVDGAGSKVEEFKWPITIE